jgi:antitoxin VapB
MPLHIRDNAATKAVRSLAARRRLTLTDAVRVACEEALERDSRARPVGERVAAILAQLDALPSTGSKADKAFFDGEWGETE